jgi:hypothetical protein
MNDFSIIHFQKEENLIHLVVKYQDEIYHNLINIAEYENEIPIHELESLLIPYGIVCWENYEFEEKFASRLMTITKINTTSINLTFTTMFEFDFENYLNRKLEKPRIFYETIISLHI